MRFLLWPFSLLNMQALSFPVCLGVGSRDPLLTAASPLQSYHSVYRLRVPGPLFSTRASDFPDKKPREPLPICWGAISVLCAILWGKKHCRPHGRLGLSETRATQRPAPAAASLQGLLSDEGCPTEPSHPGGLWAPGAAGGLGAPLLSSPKRTSQFRLCRGSWHTWGEKLDRAELDLASALCQLCDIRQLTRTTVLSLPRGVNSKTSQLQGRDD